jgi:4-hydroxy-tetrahydrodipicolinate reductase
MIRIALTGANGRMGQSITQAIANDQETSLVLKMYRTTAIEILKHHQGLMDVLIDFSLPFATLEYLKIACDLKIPLVIGTTGFSEKEKALIKAASSTIPIVFSPNMSIGINLMYRLLAMSAKTLKDRGEVGIIDIHHRHKKDAPSGTAKEMAAVLEAVIHNPDQISMASLRVGDQSGTHQALFSWEGETLEITHRSSDRQGYALGSILAAKWILGKPPKLYNMQDVLSL